VKNIAFTLDRALERLYAACGVVAAFSIILIAVFVATKVISRLMGVYIGGLTEGAGYAMAAAGSFGLACTFQAGGHIRVDLVIGKLTGKLRNGAELVALVMTTGAVIYLAWFMTRMVFISWRFGDISSKSDGLPLWLPQLPAATGICIFGVALVHNLIRFCLKGASPWTKQDNLLSEKGN
jgi:TRAP-type C4-dicarboxylate transport system permease small subunit|tara:strand:+ start:195 stop:734 length:540 start_codon:yes stop_codon:yes gene_type:complete